MADVGAFTKLLDALSRIPGLGFLRSVKSDINVAKRLKDNVGKVTQAAKELKGDDPKKEEGKENKAD